MVATEHRYQVIGTRPIRPDGVDKVTGRAAYGADIALPGMLHARVLRSPHAHARILRIDTSAAERLPGVRAVVTHADFPEPPDRVGEAGEGPPLNLRHLLDNTVAGAKALYAGHALAAVAAVDAHTAADALALIRVEYEVLPPVLNVRDAMLDTAPLLHDNIFTQEFTGERATRASNVAAHLQFQKGDVTAGFLSADVVLEREFETSMVHQGYIEPQSATVLWNAEGQVTIWTSTQGTFIVRDQTALLLQIPVSRVRVVPMEIGGGFGGKTLVYMEPLAAVLSRKSGHPVKMTMTREEVLKATGPTSGTYVRAKIGARRDGTIIAAQAFLAYEAGAYPGSPVGAGAMCMYAPYDVANVLVDGYDVVVNRPKVAAYRAPGAPAANFAAESLIDELARRLDRDPMDLRLQNHAHQGSRRVDGQIFGVIGNREVMEAVRQHPHYQSELPPGEHTGRGVAIGFWFNAGLESSSYAAINADGGVSLILASTDIGGSRAALAMQLAETLGIPYADVHPTVVDTNTVGWTHATVGSRTAFAGGWAAYEVGQDLRRQMVDRAARIWDLDPAQVVYGDDGIIRGPAGPGGAERAFSFKALAAQLQATGGLLVGRATVQPNTAGPAFAGHIVDVRVDPETGKVDILRYTAVQDVGTAIHPSYVEGQMQGGVSQGAGWALNEEYFYNAQGQMVNASLLDYRMPTTLDLPMIDTVLVEVPNPGHPFGVRGVGEVPIVPPLAAIANAVHDATGLRMTRLPISPRALLERLLPDDG